MQFLPELKKFLIENGRVYTVRKFDMRDGDVFVEGVGVCHRKPLGRIYGIGDLHQFVASSGFATVEDWWAKVRYFIPSPDTPMFLYLVEVKKE